MNFERTVESRDGILIVGHGTHHEAGLAELHELARGVAKMRPKAVVRSCFLELAPPTIAEGFEEIVAEGVRRVIAAPIMLLSAQHVQVDIPEEVATAAAKFPEIEVAIAGHLGCHEKMVELSNLRYAEALAGETSQPERTLLVMVGRGSHDPGARGEMQQFTKLCVAGREVSASRIGYLAMARPPLDEVLKEAGEQGFERVVVQPHLLFEGVLLERLRGRVSDYRDRFPQTQWFLAERLGPHRLVAETIVDRVQQAWEAPDRGSRTLR